MNANDLITARPNSHPSSLFKGIALFTPGGDLVYCIDPDKQARWHLHLCLALQELLGLPEPPHFLVPCYTATIDRWRDPTAQIHSIAEAAPTVLRFQSLLNAAFMTEGLVWHAAAPPEGVCDLAVLSSYRQQFPQLWETHDLVVRYDRASRYAQRTAIAEGDNPEVRPETQGYVLRLFVSGHSAATERTLQTLHRLLEHSLGHPYTLKVIDVFQHPELAERDQVAATPTLVRVYPRPVRRIVGELENPDRLLRALTTQENWRGHQ